MGNEIFLYFLIEEEQHTARVNARKLASPGSEVKLYLDTEKFHYFNNDSGERIQ